MISAVNLLLRLLRSSTIVVVWGPWRPFRTVVHVHDGTGRYARLCPHALPWLGITT